MKISIITVCYNSSKTIEKTFKSVENQTYSNLEYIIVDGNSKDGTQEIIEKYKHIFQKSISEPDKGLYDAMNKGIEMATGDYIGIINADDIFKTPTVVEDIANFLHKNMVEACVGDIEFINEVGTIVRYYSSKKWLPNKLKIGFMPPHPSIFFKKELFNAHGKYRLDFKIAADYELIIRFFLKNKISWAYSDICTTTMLTGGLSSSGIKSYNKVTEEINKGLNLNNIPYSKFKVLSRGIWKKLGLLT